MIKKNKGVKVKNVRSSKLSLEELGRMIREKEDFNIKFEWGYLFMVGGMLSKMVGMKQFFFCFNENKKSWGWVEV